MRFEDAVEVILRHEGGYVNDPADPGGETKYGISKRAYPDVDIAALTRDDAAAIYRRDYWDRCRCDELPEAVRLMVFDTAVNMGPGQAVKFLQEAAGATVDGVIGPQTIARAAAVPAPKLVREYALHRIMRYSKLPTFPRFGLGWTRRTLDVAYDCFSIAVRA